MSKDRTWVLVADAENALVFEKPLKQNHLDEAPKYTLVAKSSEAASEPSDQRGRTFDRAGDGRHAKEPTTDPARHQKTQYAREIASRLESERKREAFGRLILVAPPQFLGDLRKSLSDPLRKLVVAEVGKDLSHLPIPEIDEHLGIVLRPYEH